REPAEVQALERLVERELELAPPARLVARIALGRKPEPYLPQKPTPGEPEPVAPAHPHEVLDRRALELRGRAPHDVAHAPKRAALLALGDDRRGRFFAPVTDKTEPDPHRSRFPFPLSRFPFYRAPHIAHVDVGEPNLDPVPLGVPPQRVQGVEPHRLVVEEGAVILGGM